MMRRSASSPSASTEPPAPLLKTLACAALTYQWRGRQVVVIAAGGHSRLSTTLGDTVVAFALPG